MKKITLIAALLGSVYFANAQVGIGTPDPAVSAELEIFSTTKGLLIPRVELTDIKIYKPIEGSQVESLLVYNINEVKDATDNNIITLPKGFYYWDGAKWNRIVSKSELDKAIENLGDNITKIGADVTNLKNLINYIVPTNPGNVDSDGKPVVGESHTTIVYDPKNGEMSYVTYEGGKYVTKAINLTNMIRGIETNTFFIELKDNNGKVTGYVYFNEATITKAIEEALKDPANKDKEPKAVEADIIKGLNADTPGAITIDVKGTVVNNIKEILESPTSITIQVDGKDKTFTTVEEYLQYITQFSEGNVIYTQIEDPNDANKKIWAFQYYDAATKAYKTINLNDLVKGAETKTFIRKIEETGKANKFVYFSEQTIIDWLAADKANTVDNIPNDAPGAVTVDIMKELTTNIEQFFTEKTTVLKEGSTTEYHTVQELIENISKNVSGNVIYTQIEDPNDASKKIWVFQYYDEATKAYKTINLNELVAAAETKTSIVTYNNKQYYLSESYINGGGEVDVTKWTAVPAGAIHIDVVGGVINNIEEILTTKGNITIQVDGKDKTFTTVEEYLQYITQFSEGNVIYKEIEVDKDPSDPSQGKEKVWVFQYYDAATNEYKTINLNDLVKGAETKTTITRTESKADKSLEAYAKVNAPIDTDVKKGEIFYKYDNEAGQPDYINMTGDILSSIENNEKIKNAITNVLNAGGNVYFGDHDGDEKDTAVTDKTPHVFYQVVFNDKTNKYENKEIELPLSMLTNLIKKYKDVVKTALGDNITNVGDIVFTGNVYNGRYVFLAKGTTKAGKEVAGTWVNSARTTGVDLPKATDDLAIKGILSIKLMKGDIVVANSATDIKLLGTKVEFNIGMGSQFIVVPTGDYDVVVEYTGDLVK
ncbi:MULTISPECIES: hypothetical protein [unclassified Myroides]|uniref:hypothetical protein n=1 Tax=unclassified Myroides TaxID=2642485 RepID=UPI0031010733